MRCQATTAQLSQGQPRTCHPHRRLDRVALPPISRRPTIQITPPNQAKASPDRIAPLPSFFFSLLPQLFFSLLLNVIDLATIDHQPTPLHPQTHLIWPPPSSIHADLSFPDLSLVPSISPSFLLLLPLIYHVYVLNMFLFWFLVVLKVYILKFSNIIFFWKLRKWLRKCEKFVEK